MAMVMKSVKFEQETLDKLQDLAKIRDRDVSYVIREAVNDMIEAHEWQLEQSMETVRRVRSGEEKTYSHEEIGQWLKDEGMVE